MNLKVTGFYHILGVSEFEIFLMRRFKLKMSIKAAGWELTCRILLLHHGLIKGGVSKALIDSVSLCSSASGVEYEISVLFRETGLFHSKRSSKC